MGSYSISEAISLIMEKSGWKPKANEIRLRAEWETIVGKTIARYTKNLYLYNQVLTIYTDMPALKQELVFGKEQLMARLNEHFGEKIVKDIIVK